MNHTTTNCYNITYDTARYKQKCIQLHEAFTFQRNRIVSDEMNEINRARKNLEKHCHQLRNIIFGQDNKIENVLTQTKIQNAVNIYSIVYLVWIYIFLSLHTHSIYNRCQFFCVIENILEGRLFVPLDALHFQ